MPPFYYRIRHLFLFAFIAMTTGCAMMTPPPSQPQDACAIFEEKGGWYHATKQAEEKWNIPAPMILAFIRQESSFQADAKPPRKKVFGFIPWTRPSSAYGYSQAIRDTWEEYEKETGRSLAFRNRYSDSTDFIGWYNNRSVRALKLMRTDAYNLYLAYHEGIGAYRKKSYEQKKWLIDVAKKVEGYYKTYDKQLKQCADKIETRWYQKIFVEKEPATPDKKRPIAQGLTRQSPRP